MKLRSSKSSPFRIVNWAILFLGFFPLIAESQVYMEKQTRHRFAQLNVGCDWQTSFGGQSQYINSLGQLQTLNLSRSVSPRILIGGTHFWGHADFYIAIPVYSSKQSKDNQVVKAFREVETVFKYYPWRIQHHQIRPFVGTSISPFYVQHSNNYLAYAKGPELNVIRFPLHGGFTFASQNHLLELGVAWNYANRYDYYITRDLVQSTTLPGIYTTLSYRYMIETTLSAEKDWESGRTQKITDILAEQGRLNGFYFGVGFSSAFWLKRSSYNIKNRPYIEKYNISTMPDFTLGYYFHQADLNIALGYRGYRASTDTYGAVQLLNRKSGLLEATKYLFDYHGFVPFLGANICYENLLFNESFEGQKVIDVKDSKFGYGLTFGWDIRPNRIQTWLLRTNLRWYPNLSLHVEPNSSIAFDNLEFNFIQFVIFPGRMMKRRTG